MPSDDAKAVKKEEEADDKSLSAIRQARKKDPTNVGSLTAKPKPKVKKEEPQDHDGDDFDSKPNRGKVVSSKAPAVSKRKKEDNVDDDDDDDHKPISRKASATKTDKELNKKRKTKEEEKKKAGAQQNGKREKKVYDLPGQKRDPPEERDPLRIFYETLYQQVPNSEMAQFWMMESGLLSKEEAKKVYEKKQKIRQKLTSPVKAATATKKTQSTQVNRKAPASPVSSTKKKTTESKVISKPSKKRKSVDVTSEDDSDDDFLVNRKQKKQRAS